MKLYVLPYHYYENYLKDSLNIFRRDYNLYQFEDTLFLFYNTYSSVLQYNLMFNVISSKIDDFDVNVNLPEINFKYSSAFKILSRYRGDFSLVKVICPDNDFMIDEFKYFMLRLGIEEFEYVKEDEFENKSIMFFETYGGEIIKSNINYTIYFTILLNYLNHIVNMFFIKSTVSTTMNLWKLLIYIKIKENYKSNKIKKISLIDGTNVLAYKIMHGRLIKDKEDSHLYTIQNWDDRYISHKVFEGVLLNIDGELYTTEDKIDTYEILDVQNSNKILTEMLSDLEDFIPQHIIKKTIEEYDVFGLDENDTINFIPNWNINYPEIYSDLNISKGIMETINDVPDRDKIEIIKENIRIITQNLEKSYSDKGIPLGICPECNKGYVWKSNKGYFCDNCDDFILWNKSLETRLGFIPNKYQIRFMLNNNRMFTIKNKKFKLIEYTNKENVKIWQITKLK